MSVRCPPPPRHSCSCDGRLGHEGILSVDTLTMGGLATTVTFGEMSKLDREGCTEVDGVLGMGISDDDGQNAFEDMLDVSRFDKGVQCTTSDRYITDSTSCTRRSFQGRHIPDLYYII